MSQAARQQGLELAQLLLPARLGALGPVGSEEGIFPIPDGRWSVRLSTPTHYTIGLLSVIAVVRKPEAAGVPVSGG